jgi:hypothetical protein
MIKYIKTNTTKGNEMPSGGWRPGAGRPPKPAEAELPPVKGIDDVPPRDYSPLEYLLAIVNDAAQPDWRRDRAAKAAAPYCHAPGKMDEKSTSPSPLRNGDRPWTNGHGGGE